MIRMSRKVLVIVGLAALVAASTGVAFASNHHGKKSDDNISPTVAVADAPVDEDTASSDSDAVNIDTTGETVTPSESSDSVATEAYDGPLIDGHPIEPSYPQEELPESQASLNDSYTIKRVVDVESGEDVSPQVALGKFFSECYLNTYTDGTVEICLNPNTGEVKKGVYSIYNDILYVSYGDDRIEKYPIIYTDNAVVDSIIVTDGPYDYYFG